MPETFDYSALLPVLPEIVLALGAMALLMYGAFRGECSALSVHWLAIVVLIGAAAVIVWLPGGRLVTFGGSFILDDFARSQGLRGRQLKSVTRGRRAC